MKLQILALCCVTSIGMAETMQVAASTRPALKMIGAETIRIARIENYTTNGVFSIDLTDQKTVIIPPQTARDFDALLSYTLRQRVDIACLQGDYDPIYIEMKEGEAACDEDSNCVMLVAWLGPQTVFSNNKNYIPFCCGKNAAFKLVIHEKGEVEILPMEDARYF